VFILESNGHNAVPNDWRFSVQRWPLSKLQYDGVSLLHIIRRHDWDNLNSVSMRLSLRQYNSTRRRRVMCTPRLECKLCENSIRSVASENWCPMRCTQYFPREAVRAVQTKMWSADHALRKRMKLQVHRNTYEVDKRKVLSLEGHEVCLIVWSIIHSISRANFYQFKGYSTCGMYASYHGNQGTKKRWVARWHACASLAAMIEGATDLMPHRFRTLPSGERVVKCVLPSRTKWKDLQHCINEVFFLFTGYCIHIDGLRWPP
jgi:hypothetical protein